MVLKLMPPFGLVTLESLRVYSVMQLPFGDALDLLTCPEQQQALLVTKEQNAWRGPKGGSSDVQPDK